MRDAIAMWRNTKMVVLVALSAALYAAILIPFKPIPIIPGITEIRPAAAIPIVTGLLLGPAVVIVPQQWLRLPEMGKSMV